MGGDRKGSSRPQVIDRYPSIARRGKGQTLAPPVLDRRSKTILKLQPHAQFAEENLAISIHQRSADSSFQSLELVQATSALPSSRTSW